MAQQVAMWAPSNPHEWGLGGVQPADWEGYSSEPFAAGPPPRETEDDPGQGMPQPLPGTCIITCVTPAWTPRRGLIVKHGDGWLDKARCPCCGERAVIELARPVQDCAECGGNGHVPQLEWAEVRGPGALRLALRQCREVLRIRPRETVSEAKECQECDL